MRKTRITNEEILALIPATGTTTAEVCAELPIQTAGTLRRLRRFERTGVLRFKAGTGTRDPGGAGRWFKTGKQPIATRGGRHVTAEQLLTVIPIGGATTAEIAGALPISINGVRQRLKRLVGYGVLKFEPGSRRGVAGRWVRAADDHREMDNYGHAVARQIARAFGLNPDLIDPGWRADGPDLTALADYIKRNGAGS